MNHRLMLAPNAEGTPPGAPGGGAPAPAPLTGAGAASVADWTVLSQQVRSLMPAGTPPEVVAIAQKLVAHDRNLGAAAEVLAAFGAASGAPAQAEVLSPRDVALLKRFGVDPTARTAPAPLAPTAPSNTGAPIAPLQNTLPPDPRQWPADVVRKMSVEEWRKALDAYKDATGQGDPLRALRPARRGR